MTLQSDLIAAKQLVGTSDRWRKLGVLSALSEACERDRMRHWNALNHMQRAVGGSVIYFEDKAIHADILRVFDRAIKAAS